MGSKRFILGNKKYGLYYAEIIEYSPESGIAKVEKCRHICGWYGKTGGITSLAAHGPCGDRALDSKVGDECPATLSGIVAVFKCSQEAVQNFALITNE